MKCWCQKWNQQTPSGKIVPDGYTLHRKRDHILSYAEWYNSLRSPSRFRDGLPLLVDITKHPATINRLRNSQNGFACTGPLPPIIGQAETYTVKENQAQFSALQLESWRSR